MFLPAPWDQDDYRYVRNAVLIGCAIALFTEVTRGAVDVVKEELKKRMEKKRDGKQE